MFVLPPPVRYPRTTVTPQITQPRAPPVLPTYGASSSSRVVLEGPPIYTQLDAHPTRFTINSASDSIIHIASGPYYQLSSAISQCTESLTIRRLRPLEIVRLEAGLPVPFEDATMTHRIDKTPHEVQKAVPIQITAKYPESKNKEVVMTRDYRGWYVEKRSGWKVLTLKERGGLGRKKEVLEWKKGGKVVAVEEEIVEGADERKWVLDLVSGVEEEVRELVVVVWLAKVWFLLRKSKGAD